MKKIFYLFIFFVFIHSLFIKANANERMHIRETSTSVTIADNGIANLQIITASNAATQVKTAANTLCAYLQQISGASFTITTGNGSTGIAVGVPSDFPNINFDLNFDVNHPRFKQGYMIKSHVNGIYIIAATTLGIDYAIFDFLRNFGHRQFFATEKWEIIPSVQRLVFAEHIKEAPDYFSRNIWPGYGVWPEFNSITNQWRKINRNGGFTLNTGHVYDAIVNANRNIFNAHPEYFSLVNGSRRVVSQEAKFCISNADLRDLVTNYTINQFNINPQLESASIEPSDGGGWCECEHCKAIGTESTNAVYLANTVAQAVSDRFQGKKLGMYAYNMHSPAPQINVHQDVVVSVATNFISGGNSLDDIINGWQSKQATLGLREYYDVYIWSRMLPGKSSGSNIDYIKSSISDYYTRGARYMSAECSDDWGPTGLGYYIAERLLWNVDDAQNIDAIINDFTTSAFGTAATTMKNFYMNCLDGSNPKMLSADLIGRMYRYLQQARVEANGDNDILSRINDLVLYTRYSELYMIFESADSGSKQVAFNNFMNFIATLKNYRIIHTLAIDRGTHWKNMSPNPSIYTTPNWNGSVINYSNAQIDAFISQGIANNELLDFEPIGFSPVLVPVKFQSEKAVGTLNYRRGTFDYYLWVYDDLKPIDIEVTGGLIYGTRGNVKVSLYKLGGASEDGSYETLIQTDESTQPNKQPHIVTLTPTQEGLHLIRFSDGMDRTLEVWQNYDKIFAGTFNNDLEVDGTYYFYVPEGTTVIGMFHKLWRGQLYDPFDNKVYDFVNTSDYQSFPVPEGMDGKVWYFKGAKGIVNLMTVPSYFSLNPKFFLLPEEVVTKDGLNDPDNQKAFITIWEPTSSTLKYPGIGENYTIKVRNITTNKLEQTIEGVTSAQNAGYIINNLVPNNKYSIEATTGNGIFNGFRTEKIPTDRDNLKEIKQWGSILWKADMAYSFKDCINMDMTATDQPNFSEVTVLAGFFQNCTSLKGNPSITTWDLPKAFNIGLMFGGATSFNQPLLWNVSTVRHARSVFENAASFNQSLGSWTLNPDIDMYGIFNNSGINCSVYAYMLESWTSNTSTPISRTLGAKGLRYNDIGKQYRDILTKPTAQGGFGWTIMDDIYDASCTTGIRLLDETNMLVEIIKKSVIISNLDESEVVLFISVDGKVIGNVKSTHNQARFQFKEKGVYLIYLPEKQLIKKVIIH